MKGTAVDQIIDSKNREYKLKISVTHPEHGTCSKIIFRNRREKFNLFMADQFEF